ncbi:MAG: TonB family protein [Gammaproteobacteria bacterium]|nr:TonB family protein [Gammaproteobacteria bacterium]
MTIFFALLFHGIVILGITFVSSPSAKQKIPPSLDVILVNTSNSETPDKADFLAQTSQDGGGNSEKKVRRTDLFSAPTLSQQPGMAQQQASQQQNPIKKQTAQKAFITQNKSTHKTESHKKQTSKEVLEQILKPQQQNERAARMAEELSLTLQEFSQKPKEKFLNSRTKEYIAASYMRGWIDKVERLGNADYPDAAIREKLSGTLILDVVINSDGTLKEINLRRSSGHQILDDAAKRIVKMSSPFAPFSAKLQKQADIIHITRSWEFQSNQLRSY